jgi:hypothetical protein
MPVPLVVPIAVAIARAVALQAAKQGVKQISKSQTKRITAKVIAKSGGRNKVSSVQARRIAEEAAGLKARRLGGNAALRVTKPKPDVRITTRTSRGTTVTRPIKRETNKKGSAITITRKPPMSKKQILQAQIEKNAAAKRARSIEGGVGKRPKPPGGRKMTEEERIKNKGLAVVSKGKSTPKTPSLDDYIYQPGKARENLRPTIESRSSQNPASRGTNLEKAAKPFDEQMAEAERRISAGLRNRKPGKSNLDLGTGKKADLPNSKAIGEAARKRPGLRKRKEASIQQSRTSANAAMTKRGMTPAEKKTAVMKARAKARKIAKNTGAQ